MKIRAIRAAGVLAVAAGLGAGAWGQAPAQDGKQAATAPCTLADAAAQKCKPAPAAPAKSTGERFPFPGEDSSTPTRPADWGPDSPLPPDPADAAKKPGAAQPNAGDSDAPKAGADDGFSSSSSSSSGSTGSPDDPGGLTDAGSSGDTTSSKVPINHRKKLAKVTPVTPETPESRAAEDLTVADFYQNDGNFKGAYDRAKDAVQNQPDDPYSHFALAEAARKLGKLDEAKSEYALVLKLDPVPKQEKASKMALAEMMGK